MDHVSSSNGHTALQNEVWEAARSGKDFGQRKDNLWLDAMHLIPSTPKPLRSGPCNVTNMILIFTASISPSTICDEVHLLDTD